MKQTFKTFWTNLLSKVSEAINQYLNKASDKRPTLNIDDENCVNFYAMVVKKLLNYSLVECEYDIVTDSTVAEPVKKLCEDIQNNIYNIGYNMLGGSNTPQAISECWVVPYFETVGGQQRLLHSYLNGDRIRITKTVGNRIADCYMILDTVKMKNKSYFLCRRHRLENNGDLIISFFTANEEGNIINGAVSEWENISQNELVYKGADNIGFGRYRLDISETYSHALNHGLAYIENEIQTIMEQINLEFASGGRKLFPDDSMVTRKDKKGGTWVIDGYIFPVKRNAIPSEKYIEEFTANLRDSNYYNHLEKKLDQYQSLMGVDYLITKSATNGATATEVKQLSSQTISMISRVRKAIRRGNAETLKADAMYLGIREDIFSYDETYGNMFEDDQQTLNNMLLLYDRGALETADLVKGWFPTLSDEEVEAKIKRIKAERSADMSNDIENFFK